MKISTHALTWSATELVKLLGSITEISTHALTWSATNSSHDIFFHFAFQLTHSRGVRPCAAHTCAPSRIFQLTHSRGVRPRCLADARVSIVNFNSRTHVECDSLVPSNVPDTRDFNSRTHVECDSKLVFSSTDHGHFNSRTHVECDLATNLESDNIRIISTHALTWSATISSGLTPRRCIISTHALTWSATGTCRFAVQSVYRFQLTHSRGVRPAALGLSAEQFTQFQLTHSRGVRHPITRNNSAILKFQLTHSRGVRP